MEAIRSSETSVRIRATRCHLPEDDNHYIKLVYGMACHSKIKTGVSVKMSPVKMMN
jgi:hypothetical protein